MKCQESKTVCVQAVVVMLIVGCQSIVLKDVGVPAYALQGKSAVLTCDYDLENLDLYSVKWYKNAQEFYRFIPANPQPMTVYARPGVVVDKTRSDAHQITLDNLSMQSMGRYRCEVSTEGPSFATVSNFGDMVIVVLPASGPSIQGGKAHYQPGDMVDVNCTSRDSKPAADLFWTINGLKADPSLLVPHPIQNSTNDLHTATLGLQFKVTKDDFSETGDMKLKCTAKIDTIYWQSNEKSAEGFKQKRASSGDLEQRAGEMAPDSAHGLSADFSSSADSSLMSFEQCKTKFLIPLLLLLSIFLNRIDASSSQGTF